jgi:demethylmenaquinone methyltransferase/2-methoxy-6-polyprenyl-1,4-benzoquinol methylase
MPFRAEFTCLWCGRPHAVRDADDLEGWAQLCSDCLGRAGDNPFLRYRLRDALAERAAATSTSAATTPAAGGDGPSDLDAEMLAYYEARAPEYDDWYLRRGRYARGPIDDMAWSVDLDVATRWLDGLPLGGRVVEIATGTGWWSPLLASKGELWCYDGAVAPLERARERLLAHGLRAHIHVRDAWAEPDATFDVLFTGFWLSHVPRARLAPFLDIARRWLRPGGRFVFIDSRFDPASSAVDHSPKREAETSIRRLDDGRTFTIPKVFYEPAELADALGMAGFVGPSVTRTDRFFLLGTATTPGD